MCEEGSAEKIATLTTPTQAAICPMGHLLTAALHMLSVFLRAHVTYIREKQAIP